jgi:hypothetical protein
LNLTGNTESDTLVIYHFFEKDKSYIENFLHFLIFGYMEENDHLVVVAGTPTIDLPHLKKLTYVFTENRNNDYGGYCEAISIFPTRILGYKFVFFINSSVRGPFLPAFQYRSWTDVFKEKLHADARLVGSTINILSAKSPTSTRYKAKYGGREPFSHVQTMAYAMPQETLNYLHGQGFYVKKPLLTKQEVIEEYELRLSQLILANGWNIASLLPEYDAIDFRKHHADVNPTSRSGDPCFENAYFGRSAHPFELVFIKTNRNIFNIKYLERLSCSAICRNGISKELESNELVMSYVNKLYAARDETKPVLFSDVGLTPDQIIKLTKILLVKFPEFRPQIEQVLQK